MWKRTVFALLAAGLLYAFPLTSWGSEQVSVRQNTSPFTVDVACDTGVVSLDLQQKSDGSSIAIGTIEHDSGTATTITTLLRSNIRSTIGKELLAREGLLTSRSTRADHAIASCLGLTAEDTTVQSVHCSGKTCVCYPDADTSCEIFDRICTATGGQSGHNICTW